jgi:hypothetical protein
MSRSVRAVTGGVSVLLIAIAVGAGRASAQAPADAGVTRLQVATFRVKPDKIETFLALEKGEVVPALKKAGVKSRQVYRTVVGEANEFQVRTPVAGFEIYDEPGALESALGAQQAADLRDRLNACFEAVHVQFENRVNEFSWIPPTHPCNSQASTGRCPVSLSPTRSSTANT